MEQHFKMLDAKQIHTVLIKIGMFCCILGVFLFCFFLFLVVICFMLSRITCTATRVRQKILTAGFTHRGENILLRKKANKKEL